MSLNICNVAYDDILEEALDIDFTTSVTQPQLVVLKRRSDSSVSSEHQNDIVTIAVTGFLSISF